MNGIRMLRLTASGLGVVAAGAALGVAGERRIVRSHRQRPDSSATEPYGRLPADRVLTVTTQDGVGLHVEEVGPLDAPLTVIFSHGYTLEMAMWHFQRQGLADVGRLVFYDHRAHGRSGASAPEGCTLEQLAQDLLVVIEQRAPRGPVVLVGHSMGGMTIMALADHRPDLFAAGGRVVGVALLCTSAGPLMHTLFGLPGWLGRLGARATPAVLAGLGRRAAMVESHRAWGLGNDLNHVMTRRFCFGSAQVPPSVVDLMERMIAETSIEVIGQFLPTFLDHDRIQSLSHLRDAPVLVIAGARDVLTPVGDSHRMVEAMPHGEFVVLPDAGHMAMLERPSLVNLHLRAFFARSLRGAGVAA